MIQVSRSSVVRAPREQVWARVVTADGVSDEFGPLLTMRFPAALRRDRPGDPGDTLGDTPGDTPGEPTDTLGEPSIADLPLGRTVGRAWILLGGVVPVEYDDLVITAVQAPRFFQERSSLGSCRVWEHRRELEALSDGRTRVIDTLRAEPRALVPGALAELIVGALFSHRHRRLVRAFGR